MSDQMISALVAAIVSSVISAGISLLVVALTRQGNEKRALDNELSDILKIGIEYPYFEMETFTSQWCPDKVNSDERYARYELYATLVFNHLERRCKFYGFDFNKVQREMDMWSWVKIHKVYWEHPPECHENILGYDSKFSEIIAKNILKTKEY